MDYDYLTGLHTMRHMKHNYRDYCTGHNKTYMIAVDFAKLKYINDHFGHEEGDSCLKLFAILARKHFQDSILSRRSGDEFVFLTHYCLNDVIQLLIKMDKEIEDMYIAKKMKVRFSFNSGIKLCSTDYYDTLKKADFTMYFAKDNQKISQIYEESIFHAVEEKQEFINQIDKLCAENKFSMAFQYISPTNGKNVHIVEVYARNQMGQSIFTPELYHLIKINHRFNEIDWCIINRVFDNFCLGKEIDRVMINIHYQTVMMRGNDFLIRIKEKLKKSDISPKDIVFSIHVNDFDYDASKLFYIIEEIKKIGFGICLDSYEFEDNGIILSAIAKIEVDYVKIRKEFLLQMMHRSKKQIIAKHLIHMLLEMNIKPIFSCVETKEQNNFVENISDKCLIKGNYFHKTELVNKQD